MSEYAQGGPIGRWDGELPWLTRCAYLPASMLRSSDYDASDDAGPVTVVEWADAPDDDLPGW